MLNPENNMWKCGTCGREFPLMHENKRVVRDENNDNDRILQALLPSYCGSVELFDAFDCPYCGCQNITNPRKIDTVIGCECCVPEEEL